MCRIFTEHNFTLDTVLTSDCGIFPNLCSVQSDDDTTSQGKGESLLESLGRSLHPELMKVAYFFFKSYFEDLHIYLEMIVCVLKTVPMVVTEFILLNSIIIVQPNDLRRLEKSFW